MSEILTRLRGYNPPDRTIDIDKRIALDIWDAADEIERLRSALDAATREAEEERRTAEAAVKFLGRIAEVTWEAGLPSGDREQTLKNVRALVSRPAPPADAAREAAEGLRRLALQGAIESPDVLDALNDLLAALSAPAPAPSTPAKEKP